MPILENARNSLARGLLNLGKIEYTEAEQRLLSAIPEDEFKDALEMYKNGTMPPDDERFEMFKDVLGDDPLIIGDKAYVLTDRIERKRLYDERNASLTAREEDAAKYDEVRKDADGPFTEAEAEYAEYVFYHQADINSAIEKYGSLAEYYHSDECPDELKSLIDSAFGSVDSKYFEKTMEIYNNKDDKFNAIGHTMKDRADQEAYQRNYFGVDNLELVERGMIVLIEQEPRYIEWYKEGKLFGVEKEFMDDVFGSPDNIEEKVDDLQRRYEEETRELNEKHTDAFVEANEDVFTPSATKGYPAEWDVTKREKMVEDLEMLVKSGFVQDGRFVVPEDHKNPQEVERLKAIYDQYIMHDYFSITPEVIKRAKDDITKARDNVVQTQKTLEFLGKDYNKALALEFLQGKLPAPADPKNPKTRQEKLYVDFQNMQKNGLLPKTAAELDGFIKNKTKQVENYNKEKANNMEFVSEYFEHPLKFAKEHPDLVGYYKENKQSLKEGYKIYKKNKKYLEKIRTSPSYRARICRAAGLKAEDFDKIVFDAKADPNKVKEYVDKSLEDAKIRRKNAIKSWIDMKKSAIKDATVGRISRALGMAGRKLSSVAGSVTNYVKMGYDLTIGNVIASTTIAAQNLKDRAIDKTIGRIIN